nr:prepilin-type N-terminal cleavage/methylation domain-containing protein [uncultured Rhodoferax sp.]
MARKQQAGFTIIELVITITIIAILAAIALPRYVALQSDARAAKLQGALASVRSAAALAKAICMTQTATGATTSLLAGGCNVAAAGTVGVIMDGQNVLTGFSYPTAAAGGIQVAAQLLATDYTVTFAGTVMTVRAPGAPTPANCQFTYTWAPVANGAPTVSAATITGC